MDITGIIERVLGMVSGGEVIVIVQQRQAANLRWANNTLTTNGYADQLHIALFVINEKRVGSIISSLDSHTDLEALVKTAQQKALASPAAFDAMPLLPGKGTWEAAAKQPAAAAATIDHIYDQLADCLDVTKKAGRQLFGYSEAKRRHYWLATSTGLRKYATETESLAELNLKTADFKKSVWAGAARHNPKDLDLKALYANLEQKMTWSANTISLPAGKYETILEPSAVADLLIYGYWSSAARDADEGRNAYSRPNGKNAIGEKLYGNDITIYSDPHAAGVELPPFALALSTSAEDSIFDNGLDLKQTFWIKQGVQAALITPRYWAKRQKREATPWIGNLIFEHKGPSLDEMIAKTARGLLVTCLWYIREVDPQNLLLTGLTRDGIFLIEKGKVVGAANNFRFNMSPIATLRQTTEIGTSEATFGREFGDYFTFVVTPPLRVKNFNMSSISEAI